MFLSVYGRGKLLWHAHFPHEYRSSSRFGWVRGLATGASRFLFLLLPPRPIYVEHIAIWHSLRGSGSAVIGENPENMFPIGSCASWGWVTDQSKKILYSCLLWFFLGICWIMGWSSQLQRRETIQPLWTVSHSGEKATIFYRLISHTFPQDSSLQNHEQTTWNFNIWTSTFSLINSK